MSVAPAAPSWMLALFEGPRVLSEAGSLIPARRFLESLAPGDGHTVMVLPGFLASDRSTRVIRHYLEHWHYAAEPWNLGRNFGALREGDLEHALDERLDALCQAAGAPVSLVGWSLGGLLACEMARRQPASVRAIVTLGSPFGDPRATHAWRLFELLSGRNLDDADMQDRVRRLREPVPGVPTTAIYSKSDAIVAWQIACLPPGDHVENIAIAASHLGMGFNPAVLYVIADRLRQVPGRWQRFQFNGLRKLFYH